MPLQLTTPKNTGDLDPNAPNNQYAQVKILTMTVHLSLSQIVLEVEYGNTVGNTWRKGVLPSTRYTIRNLPGVNDRDGNLIEPAHPYFNQLVVQTVSSPDAVIYDDVAKHLYQWLIDCGHYAGTVV